MFEEVFKEIGKAIEDMFKEISDIALEQADKMHDIRRHNGNIDKDYIRDEKGKKVYLTYEDWKERNDK